MTLFELFETESAGPGTAAPPVPPSATASGALPNGPIRRDWPEVEVRTSTRRRKTSEARWDGDRIVVSLPAHLSGEARQKTITWLVDRLVSKQPLRSARGDEGLMDRARSLSERYQLGALPTSVRWVTNQSARWGSCSYRSGEIRLSHRLRSVPDWVLDAVLVHELAHLRHPDHSARFHQLANAYPRHGEAGIFLAGYGLGLSDPTA
ncbi:MAG TPA: M48 family metallopeptidase [Acidimicrobiales bacterium]|nr:M48 family metallopeptidase [Acidimicrobiales bacterium]